MSEDKQTEWSRAIAGFLLGIALGALVGLLGRRKQQDAAGYE
jgi:uncharacterized membrane-anchored protein YhcB (DUF1043 family)